jgi:nitrilase
MYPDDIRTLDELVDQPDVMCRGGSAIVSPLGEVLAGPLYGEEGILYATLDRGDLVRSKVDLDVVGHYARSDVLQLLVDERAKPPVRQA